MGTDLRGRFGGIYPDASKVNITTIVAVDVGRLSNVGGNGHAEGDERILKDREPFFLLDLRSALRSHIQA